MKALFLMSVPSPETQGICQQEGGWVEVLMLLLPWLSRAVQWCEAGSDGSASSTSSSGTRVWICTLGTHTELRQAQQYHLSPRHYKAFKAHLLYLTHVGKFSAAAR